MRSLGLQKAKDSKPVLGFLKSLPMTDTRETVSLRLMIEPIPFT